MIIVVGMNPSPVKDTKKVRKNSTFDRLYGWMDQLGVNHYSFINCCNEQKAKLTFDDVDLKALELTREYPKVFALGGFASDALKRIGVKHCKLPHPSPRNLHLNSADYVAKVIGEAKLYLGVK